MQTNKLLVFDLAVSAKYKLKDTVMQKGFEQAVSMKCQQIPVEMSAWGYIKNELFEAADEIC